MQSTIGFIGGGHMTAAIVSGLVQQISSESIAVSNRSTEKLSALAEKFGIHAAASNADLVQRSDVVVLSVKPQILRSVLEPLQKQFASKKPLVISVAAGIQCRSIERWIGVSLPLVRSMPNVPSSIQEGATGLFAGPLVEQQHRSIAEQIFNAIGISAWVQEEDEIDLVTALSGSGPAYAMIFIESMIEAAMTRGMGESAATKLAIQTVRGTAGMIASSDKPLSQLIEDMLLPGGTTEQAVAALRHHQVPQALDIAIGAAYQRAGQLAQQLGEDD